MAIKIITNLTKITIHTIIIINKILRNKIYKTKYYKTLTIIKKDFNLKIIY